MSRSQERRIELQKAGLVEKAVPVGELKEFIERCEAITAHDVYDWRAMFLASIDSLKRLIEKHEND